MRADFQRRINEELADAKTPLQREVAVTRVRAKIVAECWDVYGEKDDQGIATFQVAPGRTVTIGHVEYVETDGVPAVEVWTGPKIGEPAFRVVNPPLLAADPVGAITVSTGRGDIKFRGDPLAALARAIGRGR